MKRKNMDIFTMVAGVANLLLGALIWTHPVICHFGSCVDVRETKFVVTPGLSIIGIFMIIASLRPSKRDYKAMYVCPKCESLKPFGEVKDEVCPVCGVKMEPLKGFYERHPERKDKE